MKRRAFLSASAAVPLAGITAALPLAGVAVAQEGPDFQRFLDVLEKLSPKHREVILRCSRALVEASGGKPA